MPNDPRGQLLSDLAARAGADATALSHSILALPGLAPEALVRNGGFTGSVDRALARIRRDGLRGAIAEELAG